VLPSLKVPVAKKPSVLPTFISLLTEMMFSETKVAFVIVTVAGPICPANIAEIVDVPGATPVTCPRVPAALLTVATEACEDVQMTAAVKSCVLPSPKVPMAVNPASICSGMVELEGVTTMEVKGAASTRRLAVLLNAP